MSAPFSNRGGKILIKTIAINTDNRCYNNCLHCPYGDKDDSLLATQSVIELLVEFKKRGGSGVVLAAREPLIEPAYSRVGLPLIRESQKLGLKVGANVSIGGLSVALKNLSRNNIFLDSLYVSLDGLSGVHNQIRRFDEERILPKILYWQNEILSVSRGFGISVTVMKQNMKVLPETLKLAQTLCLGGLKPFVAICSANKVSVNNGCQITNGDFVIIDSMVKDLGGSQNFVLEIPSNSVPNKDLIGSKLYRDVQGIYYIKTSNGNIWRYYNDKVGYHSAVLRVLVSGEIYLSYDIENNQPVAVLGRISAKEVLDRVGRR